MKTHKALAATLVGLIASICAVLGISPAAAADCGAATPSESAYTASSTMDVTATMYWKNCTGPVRGQLDDPRRFTLAYVYNGSPNCDGFFGGFMRLDYTLTAQDNAGKIYTRSGSVDCQSDGVNYIDISLDSPMLDQSENSRWSVKVTARYNNAPDHSSTMYGDFTA